MKRLAVGLVLLPLLLAVPAGLLVYRAFVSSRFEHQERHRVTGELLFGEMERQLALLVAREDARSFGEYRRQYVPQVPAGIVRNVAASPLFEPPPEPFIVGHFQIDPDGSVVGPASWRQDAARAEVERAVERWRPAVGDRRSWAGGEFVQAAGTTVPVQDGGKDGKRADVASADVFQSFAENAQRAMSKGGSKSGVVPRGDADVFLNAPERDAPYRELPMAGASVDDVVEDASVGVLVDPLSGHRVDARHLILARTVVVGDKPYRQGLVLDVAGLHEHLAALTLRGNKFAPRMRLVWDASVDPDDAGYAHGYRHRFAEPFESLHATILMQDLAPSSDRYVLGLAALLAAVTLAGLGAIYYMVWTALSYVQRRGNFVSAVTHELKTPLTAIRMHAEMLRDGMVPTDQKRGQYYATLTAEAERLTRLVDNVLELSRLERGNRPMAPLVGDVRCVLEEAAAMLAPHARSQGFEILVDCGQDVPAARFDREALVQVAVNLVDNALKYARDAEDRTVVLACRREGDRVIVSVLDRGPGVAGAHLGRIFEPFYRAQDEMTRRAPGTGIGLALVKGLAERMGAVVAGRNREGGGFEVSVSLAAA